MAGFERKGIERRREDRVPLRTAVSYRNFDSPGKIKNAISQDICGNGLSLLSASTLREHEGVDLWLLDPETDQLINLEGEVAWVAVDDLYGDSPYWVRAGIRVTYAEKGQASWWKNLVEKRGAAGAAPAEEGATERRISYLV